MCCLDLREAELEYDRRRAVAMTLLVPLSPRPHRQAKAVRKRPMAYAGVPPTLLTHHPHSP